VDSEHCRSQSGHPVSQNAFGGGQIDLTSLLAALDGRPLQAEIEEVSVPRSGEPQRRSGRVQVDSRGRIRCDVQEDAGPAVMFAYDFERRLMVAGLADDPASWQRTTWPFPPPHPTPRPPSASPELRPGDELVEGLPCSREEFTGADGARTVMWRAHSLGIPLRIESNDARGTHLYRVHAIRYEEPRPEVFPSE
jgi:hypothetical protein